MRETCPRCGEFMPQRVHDYALSRTDNKTHICPPCGVREAHEAWQNKRVMPQEEWQPQEGDA